MPHPITPQEIARNATVEANLRLVPFHLKRHFARRGWCDWDDVVQEGTFGLLRAVEKHDAAQGASLLCYAGRWIRTFANDAVGDATGPLRVPVGTRKLARRAERTGDPGPEHVRAAVLALHLSARTAGEPLPAEIAAPDPPPDHRAELAQMWDAVGRLPEPDRTAIRLRYGEGLTWRATAARIGCSREGARYYALRAIEQLRRDLGVREEVAS